MEDRLRDMTSLYETACETLGEETRLRQTAEASQRVFARQLAKARDEIRGLERSNRALKQRVRDLESDMEDLMPQGSADSG